MSVGAKTALVFGSNGAMGRSVFRAFQAKGWNVVGVDLGSNSQSEYVTVPLANASAAGSAQEELLRLLDDINSKSKIVGFDAVVNAAGGWAGGGAASKDIAAASELMWNQSVKSSIACAHIATTLGTNTAAEGTLLVLTGAAATTGPTPGMLAYGTAKAAVDHITRSVAVELTEINPLSSALEVAPVTIDTPGNRQGMPDADFSNWTPCEEISGKILSWAHASKAERPKNGSIMKVETKGGKSTWTPLFE